MIGFAITGLLICLLFLLIARLFGVKFARVVLNTFAAAGLGGIVWLIAGMIGRDIGFYGFLLAFVVSFFFFMLISKNEK